MKKITVLGGGTGSYVVLSGLKKYPADLAAIVAMTDSGGSTGRLRDQLGVLPPGDLRQCLVALSEAPILWRRLFLYRFEKGDLKGHNFGNIFLSALEKVSANYQEVIDTVSFVLKTKGKVLPVTLDQTHLCVEYECGKVVKGEGNIDQNTNEKTKIKKAYLEPVAKPNKLALEKVLDSNLIIIGPGDLYTSIIPILLVSEMKDSLKKTKAKIVYIVNLMTKSGQTTNYKASDHLTDLKNYLGREPDSVIINNGLIPQGILNWYLEHSEKAVEDDFNGSFSGKIIRADIIDRKEMVKDKSDKIFRSILRHDSDKLAQAIYKLI